MSLNLIQDIKDMHKQFGVKSKVASLPPEQLREFLNFRFRMLEEELIHEGKKAVAEGNPEEVVDSLIDLVVVALGTLDAFEVDAQTAWDEVLRANLCKKPGVKESRPNPFGLPDLIKPKGWKAPDHAGNYGIIPKAYEEN